MRKLISLVAVLVLASATFAVAHAPPVSDDTAIGISSAAAVVNPMASIDHTRVFPDVVPDVTATMIPITNYDRAVLWDSVAVPARGERLKAGIVLSTQRSLSAPRIMGNRSLSQHSAGGHVVQASTIALNALWGTG